MILTTSTDTDKAFKAPDFSLINTIDNSQTELKNYISSPTLIVFICNHCPYVVHLIDALVTTANTIHKKGVKTIAISANDPVAYPQDAPDKMQQFALKHQFSFPYCFDETQDIARAYGAVCTPDFYLFDAQHELYYRGQFDDSRPGNGAATGASLRHAVDQMLAHTAASDSVKPSVGCSIKWRQ